jgi:hypothetical protein
MFGPLPAIGLVELVAELKLMPDVEVSTYLHQSWPSLVEDINRQAPGTHTVVVGYSLGANSSVFVANSSKYVDLIIALQPSMLSWNPPLSAGKVGRMIEIYNPNPWMTFGGMGSKKLIGGNIEYIANYDSHPGAQFSSEFRDLVKSEIAKLNVESRTETAQADASKPTKIALLPQPAKTKPAAERPVLQQKEAAKDHVQIAQAELPRLPTQAKENVAVERQKQQQRKPLTAFLDTLSSSVNSGYLVDQRRLTVADMKDYAERTYHASSTADLMKIASD